MSFKLQRAETIVQRQAHVARAGAIYAALIGIIFAVTYLAISLMPIKSSVVRINDGKTSYVKRCTFHGFLGEQSKLAGPPVETIEEANRQSCGSS